VIRHRFLREPRKGDVIRGDVLVPEGPPPRSAVILVHDFQGSRNWSFLPWLAGRLVGAGHAVVSFDFSRNGIGADPEHFTELERFGANTLSLEQEELRFVVTQVLDGDLLPTSPREVGLLGHGRGGSQAVLTAAGEARIAALVTWAAFSYFDRWTTETKARWRRERRIWVAHPETGQQLPVDVTLLEDLEARREDLDVTAAAARVRAPWLIVHGANDMNVWSGEARTLARANPRARLYLAANADHTFQSGHLVEEPSISLSAAAEHAVRHFDAHLGGTRLRRKQG
jgi:pimeloyl-ACP methyl ester carboxylesterase